MTSTNEEYLNFARVWSSYGGGSAGDILVQFGLTEQDYFRRLSSVVAREDVRRSMTAAEWTRIKKVCDLRLMEGRRVDPPH